MSRLTIDGYDYNVPPNVKTEVERLRVEVESLKAERLRQDGESFLNLRAEVERLRALLDPDNDDAVMLVAGELLTFDPPTVKARAVLAALRKEAER